MLEAAASELESAKAEVSIKTSDLQAVSALLSQTEEQLAAAVANTATIQASSSETISKLEVSCCGLSCFLICSDDWCRLKLPNYHLNLKAHAAAWSQLPQQSSLCLLPPMKHKKSCKQNPSRLRSCR
jgi:hypothetical protein